MDYIKPLFTLSFWFKVIPDPILPVFWWALVALFGLLVVAGVVSGQMYARKKDNYILRFSAKYLKNWFLTAGFLGFLLLFFSYERAAFLSARFWFIAWFAGFGLWLYFIVKRIKRLPGREDELKRKAQFEKYLPKKK